MTVIEKIISDTYTISTDKAKLDIALIHDFLSKRSYWAKGIPLAVVEKAIANSLPFGVYHQEKQVGFARVITDSATFAYLADVFILESHRKKGLSKQLVSFILAHPQLQGLRRWMLATQDAHSLYAASGFVPLTRPEWFMQIHHPDVYQAKGNLG